MLVLVVRGFKLIMLLLEVGVVGAKLNVIVKFINIAG